MNSYLLILHEVADESEERLNALVDVVLGLGGGDRAAVSELLHSLPAILCENLTKSEADRWETTLEAAGANVEVIQSETSEVETSGAPSAPSAPAPVQPAFVPVADVDDLEFALDQLISGEHPAITPDMMSALSGGANSSPAPSKPQSAPPPPQPSPAPKPQAAPAAQPPPVSAPASSLPKLGDLENALDDLLGESARAPEASKPSQRKATVAYDTEELARRLAEIDGEEKRKGKSSPTAPTDEFDLKAEELKVSPSPSSSQKPAPAKPLTPLELNLDFSDEPKQEAHDEDFLEQLEAQPNSASKPVAKASAPVPKKEGSAKPQPKAPEGLEVEKSAAPKPKAPKPRESGVHPSVPRSGTESKRPVSSASINVSRRNNPVVKTPGSPSVAPGEIVMELEGGPAPSLSSPPPPPPLNSPLTSQNNRVTPVANDIPIINVSASRQGLPSVSAPEPKKSSAGILIGLVVIFVVFPIAFLMMPDKGPSTAVDPQAIERLLEQQQQMLDDIRATPAPTSGQTANPSDNRFWDLVETTDKDEAELSLSSNLNSLLGGSVELRGRKFGALLQYDPKVPDQPIIFVREIIAKDLRPQDGGSSLRGDGEALLTSGTVSYRVGLDVTVTADLTSGTATMNIDVKGRKNGGLPNGGVGVEQVGPGEFRMSYKKTAVLKPKGSTPVRNDKPEGKPTPEQKSSAGKNANGSYQRIPMEFPSAPPQQSGSRR